MAKKKIDRKKAAIVGIIWSFAYFTFILYYVSKDLGFNLLSPHDWESTYIAFMAGQFAIEPDKLILLLLTLILLVPVWLIGWKAFYSVNWKMPRFLLRHKEVQFKRELIISPNKGKLQAPVKLRLQSGSPYSGLKKEAFGDLPEVPVGDQSAHHIVSVVEKETALTDVQDIIALAQSYAVDTFKDVVLEGAKVPIAISTDDKAILITLLDTPDATWIIDVTDEESEWYSETSHIPSPTAFIKKAAEALKMLEPDSNVIPAVVITNGEIYDGSDIAKHYEGLGIKILRFKNGKPENLMTLENFVAENFSLKTNNEGIEYGVSMEDNEILDDTQNIYASEEISIPENKEIEENFYVQQETSNNNTTFDSQTNEEHPLDTNDIDADISNIYENVDDFENIDEGLATNKGNVSDIDSSLTQESPFTDSKMGQAKGDDNAFKNIKETQDITKDNNNETN